MYISYQNKTIIVTGGSSGIGKASVIQFIKAGGKVIVLDKNDKEIITDLQNNPNQLFFYLCDISKHLEIKNGMRLIKKKFGTIDVLVNNAGIQTYGNVIDTDEALWDKTMDTNLKSCYLCAKYAIPLMEKTTSPVIINVGSAQGFVSQKNVTAYATSKEALHGLTRSIAINFSPKIRCLAICPGAVFTPMLKKDLESFTDKEAILEETRNIHLLKRIASPEEIANFIIFLASDKASFATGHTYRVDGGIGLKIEGT